MNTLHLSLRVKTPWLVPSSSWGASKDILLEMEHNLQEAMQGCHNVLLDPQLVQGDGAYEMAVAHALIEKSKAMTGVEQWP